MAAQECQFSWLQTVTEGRSVCVAVKEQCKHAVLDTVFVLREGKIGLAVERGAK